MQISILKDGVNESIMQEAFEKTKGWLVELLGEDKVIHIDNMLSFDFGTVSVQVQVLPWHTEDALVKVFSYVSENDAQIKEDLAMMLLKLNAQIPLGNFGITFDHSVVFSHSLPAKDMDKGELSAAIQSVAVYADQYDEIIKRQV